MIRRVKSILILIIIISTLATINLQLLPVSGIYIEGEISQDTLWTLTDSPFIVSQDIIVLPGATLTIEPGVEIRFGGQFSLLIQGRIVAVGSPGANIVFTSNKLYPLPGDWESIKLNGIFLSSLEYCKIEYAVDGICIENSYLTINNNVITRNSQNGINIIDSTVEIRNSEVSNNGQNGIRIFGSNDVTIEENSISSNLIGISLTGNLTSGVNIYKNTFSTNTQSGIHLSTEVFIDITILENIFSSNNVGITVSSQISTSITNNTFSYNNIGLHYTDAFIHELHQCDLYGNSLGVTISNEAIVDATFNYWGDESGPYHTSLNPEGKGDPVGGDGVNIDFIFFLNNPVNHINQRPVANLLTDKTHVGLNQVVTFIATNSDDEGEIIQYYFDFDDGKNSGWTTQSIYTHKYTSLGVYSASVVVKDDFGVSSLNSPLVTINVEDLNSLNALLTFDENEVDYTGETTITIRVTDGVNPVANANVTLLSVTGGRFSTPSGYTNSTGFYDTIYEAPNVTEITDVRIIATTSKTGYTDGSAHGYLSVLPPLMVEVSASNVKSEEISNVIVQVLYSGESVSDAIVTVSIEGGGNFSSMIGVTDEWGDARFTYTAPMTLTWLNYTITATANKIGHRDGIGKTILSIEPKGLDIQITAEPKTIVTSPVSSVTVSVTHAGQPVNGVSVNISSNYGGEFQPEYGITDLAGNCRFVFTVPKTTTPINITLMATANKTGYISNVGQTQIAVYLKALEIHVTASPSIIEPGISSIMTVQVLCNATPVSDVNIELSIDLGEGLSTKKGTTDSNGNFTFLYTAPETSSVQNITITATANKEGYVETQNNVKITVNPELTPTGGGLPWLLIIMMGIIIAVVVIVLVLIKLKIIQFSVEEEE